jgi:predicted Zn-dependent peptidase
MRSLTLFALALSACATTASQSPAPSSQPAQTQAQPAPAAPAKPADPDAWRAKAPALGQPPAVKVPQYQKAVLKNGLSIYVSEQSGLPLTYVAVAFRAGSAADPKGKGGLANLTYGMLLEGAGNLDAIQLADAFGDLGVSPERSTDRDGTSIGVTVLKRNAEADVSLLAQVAQKPKMSPKDFDRKKGKQLADLQAMYGEPSEAAFWALGEAVWGADHPFGHRAQGDSATVATLTLEDAKSFYRRYVGPSTTAIVFAGKVSLGEATAMVEKSFGGWRVANEALPVAAEAPPSPRKTVTLVAREGMDQTFIVAGRPGVAAGHPDAEQLMLVDAIFGGIFSSRLNLNLREAHGYTYGAFSASQSWRGGGVLLAGSPVRADVTGPAISELMGEIKGLKERPITAKELSDAKEGLIRSMPGWFETVDWIGQSGTGLFYRDYPLDRFERLLEVMRTTELARVQQLANDYYQPSLMQMVLVGDPQIAQKQVAPLGLGTLTPRTIPEAPAPKKK